MKKIYSLALVLALLLSLSTPALAEENSANLKDPEDSAAIEVTGSYMSGTSNEVVYSVDISWSNMHFAYDAGDKTWNPTDHNYTGDDGEGYWLDLGSKITVTNHSNAFLALNCDYAPADGFESADMIFAYPQYVPGSASCLVNSAEVGAEQTAEITVTPTGTLPDTTNDAIIGRITVEIEKWTSPTADEAEQFADTESGKLFEFQDTLSGNELYDNALTAIDDLRIAISAAKDTATRETYAAMVDAYLEAYAAMAEFYEQHSDAIT